MSIIAGDLKFYLTGGVANSDPNLSLGGTRSTTQVGTALHQLFDTVSPEEATAGDVEYRAIDIVNTNVIDTLESAFLYISLETGSTSSTVALGYDSVGTQSAANESTAPTDVTFSTPTSKATGIALGNIAANGGSKRFWLRRTITAGAAKHAADAGQLSITGGTA